MSLPFLPSGVDERFLVHRLRSTSIGGMAGAVVAAMLYGYQYLVHHDVHWDLIVVIGAMAAVKLALMAWYHFTN
jgi:hypothetical protein